MAELLCYDCGEMYTPGKSGNCPTCLADKPSVEVAGSGGEKAKVTTTSKPRTVSRPGVKK